MAEQSKNERPWGRGFDPDKLQVVVTGFGPFLGHSYNPSWAVASAAATRLEDDFDTAAHRLEVTHTAVEAFVDALDWAGSQVLALHVGLGARREQVCVERYAHNCRGTTPDESKQTEYPPYLAPGGPTALETHLPLSDIVEQYRTRASQPGVEVPQVRISRDAGDYVCNNLYYRSLMAARRVRSQRRVADALFIHVPRMNDTAANHLGRHLGGLFGALLRRWSE